MKQITDNIFRVTQSKYFLWAGFFAYLALIIFKQPLLFIAPNLISDDIAYFSNAYHNDWLDSLTHIARKYQYLALYVKISMLIAAKWVALEYAPYVVVVSALILYSVLAICILLSSSPFVSNISKIFALVMVALVPLNVPFAMLNYAHFYWALIAVVILVSEVKTTRQKYFFYFLLLLGGLSSPLVVFLFPVFFLKYMTQRSRPNLYNSLIIFLCGILQVIAFCSVRFSDVQLSGSYVRVVGFDQLDSFIYWLYNISTTLPLLGYWGVDALGIGGFRHVGKFALTMLSSEGSMYWQSLFLFLSLLIAYFWCLVGGEKHNKTQTIKWVLLAFGAMAPPTFIFALDGRERLLFATIRYAFVFCILMMWIFLLHAENANKTKYIFRGMCVWIVIVAFHSNWKANPRYHTHSSWRQEVKLWRKDSSHVLNVLPRGHELSLKERQ